MIERVVRFDGPKLRILKDSTAHQKSSTNQKIASLRQGNLSQTAAKKKQQKTSMEKRDKTVQKAVDEYVESSQSSESEDSDIDN